MKNETSNPAAPTPDLLPCPFCDGPVLYAQTSADIMMHHGDFLCPFGASAFTVEKWQRRSSVQPLGLRAAAIEIDECFRTGSLSSFGTRGSEARWALHAAITQLAPGEAKAAPPAVSPGDVALMDELIADISHNGGQESPERDDWAETYKAGWTRIKSTLAQPVAETTTKGSP